MRRNKVTNQKRIYNTVEHLWWRVFAKIVKFFSCKLLSQKLSIIDVRLGSKYTSAYYMFNNQNQICTMIKCNLRYLAKSKDIPISKDSTKVYFRKHKNYWKVQNPCVDQNPETCCYFGIFVKKPQCNEDIFEWQTKITFFKANFFRNL